MSTKETVGYDTIQLVTISCLAERGSVCYPDAFCNFL